MKLPLIFIWLSFVSALTIPLTKRNPVLSRGGFFQLDKRVPGSLHLLAGDRVPPTGKVLSFISKTRLNDATINDGTHSTGNEDIRGIPMLEITAPKTNQQATKTRTKSAAIKETDQREAALKAHGYNLDYGVKEQGFTLDSRRRIKNEGIFKGKFLDRWGFFTGKAAKPLRKLKVNRDGTFPDGPFEGSAIGRHQNNGWKFTKGPFAKDAWELISASAKIAQGLPKSETAFFRSGSNNMKDFVLGKDGAVWKVYKEEGLKPGAQLVIKAKGDTALRVEAEPLSDTSDSKADLEEWEKYIEGL